MIVGNSGSLDFQEDRGFFQLFGDRDAKFALIKWLLHQSSSCCRAALIRRFWTFNKLVMLLGELLAALFL